jgi:hypothetical protein
MPKCDELPVAFCFRRISKVLNDMKVSCRQANMEVFVKSHYNTILIDVLLSAERQASDLVTRLLEMNEKARKTEELLEQLERERFSFRSCLFQSKSWPSVMEMISSYHFVWRTCLEQNIEPLMFTITKYIILTYLAVCVMAGTDTLALVLL